MSWDTLPKDNLEYLLSKLKTDVLDNKVDTEAGKGLSTNDYTTADKNKLAGIAANATKVESSETNGNIKIDTVETQVYDDSEIQNLVDISLTETEYANPLSLTTDNAQNAVDTKIKIEPIQDLHGYDKPWVGGAGKNLLPLTLSNLKAINTSGTWNNNIYTLNGVTWTCNLDNDGNIISIKISGTANATGTFNLINSDYDIPSSCKYSVNASKESSNIESRIKNGSTDVAVLYNTILDDGDVNITSTHITNATFFHNTAFNDTFIVYPMIRKSTETNVFEPYSNICSISGHDQINVLGCGKNLFDDLQSKVLVKGNPSTYSNYIYDVNGSYVIPIKGGNTYTVSFSSNHIIFSSTSAEYPAVGVSCVDNYSGTGGQSVLSKTIVTSVGANYLVISTGDNLYENMQVELGSTTTTYEPYTESNNKTIVLPDIVYGGVLDLESGELVVDTTFIDMGNLTWEYQSASTRFRCTNSISNMLIKYMTTTDEIHCSAFNPNPAPATGADVNGTICTYTDQRIYVKYYQYTDASLFKTAVTGQIFTYPLATPTTIQLSPHQLSLLKAQNNLTTSQYTQVKVTYRNGVFATLEELSDTAQDIYDEISGDATTVSGNPINFTTREKQKSKSTIIDLEPIQDLHGFTKPWVGGAGKNLCVMTVEGLKAVNTDSTWSGNVYTYKGITYTILTDSDNNVIGIKVNGTASDGNPLFNIQDGISLNGNYILSGCPSGGSNMTYRMDIRTSHPTTVVVEEYGTGASFTASSGTDVFACIRVQTGVQVTNLIFYPMIRLSSVTDSTFEPYSNIASISGRNSVDIDGCGKNLCKWIDNKVINYLTGAIGTNNSYKTTEFIPVNQGAKIFITSEQTGAEKWWYDKNKTPYQGLGSGVGLRISPIDGYFAMSAENIRVDSTMVEIGDIGSLFEPYTPSTDLTISFGTTVYGGRLDVEKGELVVTDTKETYVGDVSENWTESSGRFYIETSKQYPKNSSVSAISNRYEYFGTISGASGLTKDKSFALYNGTASSWRIYAYDSDYSTSSKWKTYLVSNNLEVCYELSTPQTIQLTPQQVQLLKGINNISTTGTTITVTFKNGSVAHLDDLPDFTDYDKEKLASIDTLAITLDLLTHTLVVTQDV